MGKYIQTSTAYLPDLHIPDKTSQKLYAEDYPQVLYLKTTISQALLKADIITDSASSLETCINTLCTAAKSKFIPQINNTKLQLSVPNSAKRCYSTEKNVTIVNDRPNDNTLEKIVGAQGGVELLAKECKALARLLIGAQRDSSASCIDTEILKLSQKAMKYGQEILKTKEEINRHDTEIKRLQRIKTNQTRTVSESAQNRKNTHVSFTSISTSNNSLLIQ